MQCKRSWMLHASAGDLGRMRGECFASPASVATLANHCGGSLWQGKLWSLAGGRLQTPVRRARGHKQRSQQRLRVALVDWVGRIDWGSTWAERGSRRRHQLIRDLGLHLGLDQGLCQEICQGTSQGTSMGTSKGTSQVISQGTGARWWRSIGSIWPATLWAMAR
jgi:hypothetical protein